MDDYISREAAINCYLSVSGGRSLSCSKVTKEAAKQTATAYAEYLKSIPPADVIPRATIERGIEEAIALLNAIRGRAINGEGRLDYTAYSELHDAITGILPEKEADSDG